MGCNGCGGTNKLKSILDGFKHIVWKDADTEAMAISRAKICTACDFNKGTFCKECGCYISAKIRSKQEKCPILKWE